MRQHKRPFPGARETLKLGLLAGITMFTIGAFFHVATGWLAPGLQTEYDNVALFRPWAGWTGKYMLLHPFGYGLLFALVWRLLRERGCAFKGVRGGAIFGGGVFVVGSLPVYLLNLASFQVSTGVIVTWILQSLVQYVAAGAMLGSVVDGMTVGASVTLAAPAQRDGQDKKYP